MPQTIRVRAAVAVDTEGAYFVCGRHFSGDDLLRKQVADDLDAMYGPHRGIAIHFIEADIELPEPRTVPAEVVE